MERVKEIEKETEREERQIILEKEGES